MQRRGDWEKEKQEGKWEGGAVLLHHSLLARVKEE